MKPILILFLCIQTAFGQCDLTTNKTDEFTGNRIIQTSTEYLTSEMFSGMQMTYKVINSSCFLIFSYSTSVGSVFAVDEDDELMFKMEDGSVITVKNLKFTICESIVSSGVTAHYATLNYSVNKAQIEALSKMNVLKVRFYTTDGYIEKEVKEKRFKQIKDISNCILTYL